jgi:hypothetical protein
MEAPAQLRIDADTSPEEAIKRLQVNALSAHQRSMGRGDELVKILERAIHQMERAHGRITLLNTSLFVAGLALLVVGVSLTLAGENAAWAALLGSGGGIASLASIFWTRPLDKVAQSVTDLVKLEAAFLGYIRVIGEVDSFFQMQYLDIIGSPNGNGKATLAEGISNTATLMNNTIQKTLELIDAHVAGGLDSSQELKRELAAVKERLDKVQATGT